MSLQRKVSRYLYILSSFGIRAKTNTVFTVLIPVVFFIFLSSVSSCKIKDSKLSLSISNDTICIEKHLLNSKHKFKILNDNAFLQAFNTFSNEISLTEISSKRKVVSVVPQIDFENENIVRLIQFDVYKQDSIFLMTENDIFIIDSKGRPIYNYHLQNPVVDEIGTEYRLWDNDNQFPLVFEPGKAELTIRCISNFSYLDPNYTKVKVEVVIGLKNKSIKFKNIGFPLLTQKRSCGQAVFPFREKVNSVEIFSFQDSDSLFVFDNKTGGIKKYYARSKFQNVDFIEFDNRFSEDIERIKEHIIVTPIYQKVLYDKYRKLYYRFFMKEQPLWNKGGQINGIFDKDVCIIVFDDKFNIIDEVNIGSSHLWYYSYISKKGLHIRRFLKENERKKLTQNEEVFSVYSWD